MPGTLDKVKSIGQDRRAGEYGLKTAEFGITCTARPLPVSAPFVRAALEDLATIFRKRKTLGVSSPLSLDSARDQEVSVKLMCAARGDLTNGASLQAEGIRFGIIRTGMSFGPCTG